MKWLSRKLMVVYTCIFLATIIQVTQGDKTTILWYLLFLLLTMLGYGALNLKGKGIELLSDIKIPKVG